MRKQERYNYLIEWFSKHMAIAETELHFTNHFELLVAVILSAQCTDKRVNMVTPSLFKLLPTPLSMSTATVEEIFNLIRSISYPNNKAKHLKAMAHKLVHEFNSEVPVDMDKLQTLPGVGRKTANVMRAVAFDLPAMPVDTHVFRLAHRIGLVSNAKTPLEVEKQLVQHIPSDLLSKAHHWLILHGRYVCLARKPKCEECGLTTVCKFYQARLRKELKKNNQD